MRLVRYTYPSTRSLVSSPLFSRAPWSGLENEIDRLFETAFGEAPTAALGGSFPVDLYEDKDNRYVRAELPGVSRDAIQVEVVDGTLTLQASRKTGDDKTSESVSFSRSITLTDEVKTDAIRAQYENGVLTVTLPKKEEAKPRKISVQVG
ncbi:MAG TPA: Hsp20/alpha crystallin family protein [Opitutaceae bacterium]|jgi:HSP20 family protein|nr:Hsp20/alpha crystallin family protein [Opitutaceae bacterium]HRE04762.1 Hsp20/alpha crystallin family protein [Opitutaceae bacterium]